MRLFLFIAIFTITSQLNAADRIEKKSQPNWVNPIELTDFKITEDNVGYQYLLIDLQEHLIKQQLFRHYAVKILNSEGVQSMSDISVSYDPSYQKIEFHEIIIRRDGQKIEKLKNAVIQNIQRETNMERSLYDGSQTAIINLSDIREGDILEYSFSIIGFNPVNKGNYSTDFHQQYSSPVNRIYNRLIDNVNHRLNYKEYQSADKPIIIKKIIL
ncbi:DUF3857 domain-containing protein [Cellulophaga baltica 4]|nr:DUF3857 domain-containing protein [Cellulophaga baltica 4]